MFAKLLVPLDLTEPELVRQALEEALAIARGGDAALRLVNVQSLVPVAFIDYIPADFDEELRSSAEQELAEIATGLDYPKDKVTTVVRFGAIYPEVLAEAEDWGADLIVLSSHRPAMSTYLLGSNAKTIVRHAKCSVLVVRR